MFTGRYKDDITVACDKISKSYSPQEVALALERLGYGGPLGSVKPVSSQSTKRIVAPASTILFVPPDFTPPSDEPWIAQDSNVQDGAKWKDLFLKGSIAVVQLYKTGDEVGDVARELKEARAGGVVVGAVVQGGAKGLEELGQGVFVKGGSGVEGKVKAWSVDLTVKIDGREIKAGDIIYADEAEGAVFVLPQENLLTITDALAQIKQN